MLAIESPRVTADAIEVTEFMDLAQTYQVSSVPKIVVNDKVEFVGALPEPHFLRAVLQALEPDPGADEPDSDDAKSSS